MCVSRLGMQFYCVLRTPWPRRRPALLLLTSHVLATSTCTCIRTYTCWRIWTTMARSKRRVRARRLAILRKRRQRETDKTEAKRPKIAESHVFELVEITLTLGHLSQLSLALNLHVFPPSTRSKCNRVHTQPRLATECSCARLVTAYAYL